MARKIYSYKVVALGLDFGAVRSNIERQREHGWSLVSTYMDVNRASTRREPSVCGVFEYWEKAPSRLEVRRERRLLERRKRAL